jgi:hypothetical protein
MYLILKLKPNLNINDAIGRHYYLRRNIGALEFVDPEFLTHPN